MKNNRLLFWMVLLMGGLVWLRHSPAAPVSASALQEVKAPTLTALPVTQKISARLYSNKKGARPGEYVQYTLEVANQDRQYAYNMEVRLPVGPGMEIVQVNSSQPKSRISANGRTARVTIGNLPPGQTFTVQVQTRLTPQALDQTAQTTSASLYYRAPDIARRCAALNTRQGTSARLCSDELTLFSNQISVRVLAPLQATITPAK